MTEFYPHQGESLGKMADLHAFMDCSSPGTGKTRVHLADFWRRRQAGGGRGVVFAPKSILAPAWGNEIDKFFPGMTYTIAGPENRERAFREPTDLVLTNHDAVRWLALRLNLFVGFDTAIIDESTAYKNPSAQRSRAARMIVQRMLWRRALSGTVNPNTILDVWHQIFLLDDGERLGKSYWGFRNSTCTPVQVGPGSNHVEWHDKPGIAEAVFGLIQDMSIRHKLEDCIAMPERVVHRVDFVLSKRAQAIYDDMKRHSLALLEGGGAIKAPQASAVATKLRQIASGAVYTGEDDKYEIIDSQRPELIMDLVAERQQCLVAFEWRHQREQLEAAALARGFSYAVIDGTTAVEERTAAVNAFQGGRIKLLFAHPRSAAHGLTLTAGTTTIWASPTWSSEAFEQFNFRIYRAGQTQRTEFILVAAQNTVDARVYAGLESKLSAMELFNSLLEAA